MEGHHVHHHDENKRKIRSALYLQLTMDCLLFLETSSIKTLKHSGHILKDLHGG